MLALAKAMPIANAAKRLGEHDTRLWRIVEHYVWRAVEARDLSQVRRIAADDGKDAATVKEFADFLEAHGGKREAVTDSRRPPRANRHQQGSGGMERLGWIEDDATVTRMRARIQEVVA